MKFSSLLFAAAAAVGALATPVVNSTEHGLTLLSARAGTPSAEGNHGGYFYSWWTDNQGTAYYTNQNGGMMALQTDAWENG